MRYQPKTLSEVLRDGLASTRFTAILLAGILAIFCIGLLFSQSDTAAAPLQSVYTGSMLYFLELIGVVHIFQSAWFIVILSLLALNLSAWAWKTTRSLMDQKTQKMKKVDVNRVEHSRSHEVLFFATDTKISKANFRKAIEKVFPRKNVAVLRDDEELHLGLQKFPYAGYGFVLVAMGTVLLILAIVISSTKRFRGQVIIDEGAKTSFVEIQRGEPQGWQLFEENGRPVPGFYQPGYEIEVSDFDIQRYPASTRPQSMSSTVKIHFPGRLPENQTVAVHHPVQISGVKIYQGGYEVTKDLVVSLSITDRKHKVTENYPRLDLGQEYGLKDAKFRVVEVEEPNSFSGRAVQIEYTEKGSPLERFWIFSDFPKYDGAHRKMSRYVFSVEYVGPNYQTTLYLSYDPGAIVAGIGGFLVLLGLLCVVLFYHQKFWFIWKEGHVVVVGWSQTLLQFEPRFHRMRRRLSKRFFKLDKTLKQEDMEIRYGAL